MTESGQLSPVGRLTLWVLGGALFLDIAVVPYWLYMDYEFTGSVPLSFSSCCGSPPLGP